MNEKGYESTTVQDIINLADVGRSTFYCHYESKELLLDELCRYLFHHLFEREESISTEDYLAHLFLHFQKNQDHITSLLFSKNDYFLRQLHKELEHHVYSVLADDLKEGHPSLPISYLQHLACPTLSRHWPGGSKKDKTLQTRKLSSFIWRYYTQTLNEPHVI